VVCRLQGATDAKSKLPLLIAERRTPIIKATINPDWNVGWNDFKQADITSTQSILYVPVRWCFYAAVLYSFAYFFVSGAFGRFQCWDWDRFAEDDFMGEASVSVDLIRQQMLIALQDTPSTSTGTTTGSGTGTSLAAKGGAGPGSTTTMTGSSSSLPSGSEQHPKITMTLPLAVRPGFPKDRAAGAITVKFSLYQKQQKVKDTAADTKVTAPVPTPLALKDNITSSTEEVLSPSAVSGAGFEKFMVAKAGKGSGAAPPTVEDIDLQAHIPTFTTAAATAGVGASGDDAASTFDAVLARGSNKYASKRMAQKAHAVAESREKEDKEAQQKKQTKASQCKVQ
jgi:hypothetical protein